MSVNRPAQRSLAYALLEVSAPHMTHEDHSRLWMTVGAGELEAALFALVNNCMRRDATLPPDLAAALQDWLRGYSGTDVPAAFDLYIRFDQRASVLTDVDRQEARA